MQYKAGDIVALRDGRCMVITDAVDRSAPEVFQNPDNIVIGYQVHPEFFEDPNLGEPGYVPRTLVTDVSEIVSIIEH